MKSSVYKNNRFEINSVNREIEHRLYQNVIEDFNLRVDDCMTEEEFFGRYYSS